jgi:hypothetical protein
VEAALPAVDFSPTWLEVRLARLPGFGSSATAPDTRRRIPPARFVGPKSAGTPAGSPASVDFVVQNEAFA